MTHRKVRHPCGDATGSSDDTHICVEIHRISSNKKQSADDHDQPNCRGKDTDTPIDLPLEGLHLAQMAPEHFLAVPSNKPPHSKHDQVEQRDQRKQCDDGDLFIEKNRPHVEGESRCGHEQRGQSSQDQENERILEIV